MYYFLDLELASKKAYKKICLIIFLGRLLERFYAISFTFEMKQNSEEDHKT